MIAAKAQVGCENIKKSKSPQQTGSLIVMENSDYDHQ
jgi:hypothetical protein